jgi:hypothetical protein
MRGTLTLSHECTEDKWRVAESLKTASKPCSTRAPFAEHLVDAGLVAFAVFFEPGEDGGVEAEADGLFDGAVENAADRVLEGGGWEFGETGTSAAKAVSRTSGYGTAEAVPLSKANYVSMP